MVTRCVPLLFSAHISAAQSGVSAVCNLPSAEHGQRICGGVLQPCAHAYLLVPLFVLFISDAQCMLDRAGVCRCGQPRARGNAQVCVRAGAGVRGHVRADVLPLRHAHARHRLLM